MRNDTLIDMKDFEYWKKKFDQQELVEFSNDKEGLLWLKLKSISKKDPMEKFLKFANISTTSNIVKDRWKELYMKMAMDIDISIELLDNYAQSEFKAIYGSLNIDCLSNQLYKVQYFKWGGDQTNSLDKYLVSHYVKAIDSYDDLQSKIQEIGEVSYGYVMSSWYNHWTSILIESVFKSNSCVIPTVAQVKGVDFFINGYPFDLKVTHLPKEFIKQKMKSRFDETELGFLKKKARELKITFDKGAPEETVKYSILEKMADMNTQESQEILDTVSSRRSDILVDAQKNPTELAQWLYENQGDMRFGAENRIFLILVDNQDWDNSWTLKRNVSLLKPTITRYLDDFNKKCVDEMKLEFKYKSRTYTTYADVLFVIKE